MTPRQLTIDPRFTGIPEIAHGGYVAGILTAALGAGGSRVRLRRPVPTGRPLRMERGASAQVELRDGAGVLADAIAADVVVRVPEPVEPADAAAASARFAAQSRHPFPECVTCGPARADGLGVAPGPVSGRALVAALWTPAWQLGDGLDLLPPELVCAALDCTQLWALMFHAPPATSDHVVTATLETRLDRRVAVGEPHVVIGWPIGRDGRRWVAGGAIFGPDGALCAAGRLTAAVVNGIGVPLGRDRWAAQDPLAAA